MIFSQVLVKDLYSITLQDSTTPNPICLMLKQHRLNMVMASSSISFKLHTINLLSKNNIVNGLPKLKYRQDQRVSSCELGKAKRKSFHTKTTPSSKRRLQLLHMDLCGPMRVNAPALEEKKYVLVIVDDYSEILELTSEDQRQTPGVLIDFLTLVQRGLHAQVTTIRTDKGTKFLNKSLHAYFAKEGIRHETSTARTPEQNGVVERRNRTLVEAARTMLSAAKVPLFFWAEAIATACFTQNCSHLDGENLDKMKEKFNFDELPQMASDHVSSDPGPQCSTTVLEQDSLSPGPQSQENVPQVAEQ
ncbi:retrovirus-related pol polyprotein from transposon TNT 1-94 [Tanacetum coccineum]